MVNPSIQDKRRYVKVKAEGLGWFIAEPREADAIISDDPETTYTTEDVWMTQAAFEKLPEFEGW